MKIAILLLAVTLQSPALAEEVAAFVQLSTKLVEQLKYNYDNDRVELRCSKSQTPIKGTYEIKDQGIAYRFVGAPSIWTGDDCWVDHYGALDRLPKAWYRKRATGSENLIRASEKGKIKDGILRVDFYEATEFLIPDELTYTILTTIDLEGRHEVEIASARLDCPQISDLIPSQITQFAKPEPFTPESPYRTITYTTPFVAKADRKMRCEQTLVDTDGLTYRSRAWIITGVTSDLGFYSGYAEMIVEGRPIYVDLSME